jgi:hypothetical protein
MTWLQFLLWLAGIYALYYLFMIVLDMNGRERAKAGAAMSNELTFSESVETLRLEPQQLSDDHAKPQPAFSDERILKLKAEPEMISSGGVSLKSLFAMARDESVLYTRPVSF